MSMVWYGMVWYGMVWYGIVLLDGEAGDHDIVLGDVDGEVALVQGGDAHPGVLQQVLLHRGVQEQLLRSGV